MTSTLSVSNLERQIVRAATDVVKSTVGDNIERIAEKVADTVEGVSVAEAVKVIDRDWASIAAAAGKGELSMTKFAGSASDTRRVDLENTLIDLQMKGEKRVTELPDAKQRAAGTIKARKVEEGDDTFVVHGPQYWELMQHTKPFERNWFWKGVDKALSYVPFLEGMREKVGYDLTRLRIRREWGTGSKETANRGISGSEIEALTKPGPNGEPALMQPGDALLCGGGGDGGLTHAILYAGLAPANHPDAGAPMIIHAMATLKEGAGKMEWIADQLKQVHHNLRSDVGLEDERFDDKTGVLYERLGDFFNRYHRDAIMVVRDATLSPEQIEKGIAHAQALAGYDVATGKIDRDKRVPYDYKLAPDDLVSMPGENDALGRREYLAKYCTEVWLASNYVAHGQQREKLPYVGTCHYSKGSPGGTFGVHETFIAEPEDLAVSPDLQWVLVAGAGAHALAEALRTRLRAPIASIPRDQRPIPKAYVAAT